MIIDCTSCAGRGARCESCVLQLVFDPDRSAGPDEGQFNADERRAVAILVGAGLVEPPMGWRGRARSVPEPRLAG